MASGKVLSFIINAVDKVSTPFKKIGSAIASGCKAIFSNLANIKAGFDMLAGAVRKAGELMRGAFAFDDLHQQWTQLIGDTDKAREHAEMLWELGETPPFDAQQFSAASRALQNWGGEALNCRANLVALGDAAAATGQSVESVADTVGRSFALIRDGADVGRAVLQLQNMKLVTPAVANEIKAMSKAGASNAEIWAKVTASLQRYEGGMDAASSSATGMIQTLQAKVGTGMKDLGNLFLGFAKNEIGFVIHKIDQLRESGAIIKWANAAKDALRPLAHMVGNLFDGSSRTITLQAAWERLKATLSWAWDQLKAAFLWGADVIAGAIKAVFTSATMAEGMAKANARYDASTGAANAEYRRRVDAANAEIEAAYRVRMEKVREAEAAKQAAEAARRKAEADKAAQDAAAALTETQNGQRKAAEAQAETVRELERELDFLKASSEGATKQIAAFAKAAQDAESDLAAASAARDLVFTGRRADGTAQTARGLELDARARRVAENAKAREDAQANRARDALERTLRRNGINAFDLATLDLNGDWEKRFSGTLAEREQVRQAAETARAEADAQNALAVETQRRHEADMARLAYEEEMRKKGVEIAQAKDQLQALNTQTGILQNIEKNTREGNFG